MRRRWVHEQVALDRSCGCERVRLAQGVAESALMLTIASQCGWAVCAMRAKGDVRGSEVGAGVRDGTHRVAACSVVP